MAGWAPRSQLAWLVAICAFFGLLACGEAPSDPPDAATGKGIYIDTDWQAARQMTGHQRHVVGEKIACNKCHELEAEVIGTVRPERCASCHEREARLEHASNQAAQRFGAGTKTDCTTCHAFTPAGTAPDGGVHAFGQSDCARCHLERQGDVPAVRVHADAKCVDCHKLHEQDKPKSAPCSDCHAEIVATHWTRNRSVNSICQTCHQNLHAPAEDARPTCAECHAKQKPIVPASALFADGHGECVGCHRPHEFAKEKAVACRECHADIAVLGAQRVREHAQCTSCHAPHDVSGSPDRACARCHTDKLPDHPKHGVAGTCVGCHDPHPPSARAHTRARNCSSCHQSAAQDTSFHAGTDCKRCHTPHDFVRPLSDRSACTACHQPQIAATQTLSGHQKCESCHGGLPHRPAALTKGCDGCHQTVTAQVLRGHSECRTCHEPHAGKLTTTCASCHKAEHASAPAGHKNCQSCHQPHSGTTAGKTCASCHSGPAKTPHAKVQSGCNSCHRAHGPGGTAKPPPCASCHATKQLPGLHQIQKHQTCDRCHTGHGEPAPGALRAGCLGCHTDRKDHFPDAARCTGCHLFEQAR